MGGDSGWHVVCGQRAEESGVGREEWYYRGASVATLQRTDVSGSSLIPQAACSQ